MEIYLLKAFVTVASTGHLTRAAERLHVSQPALSGQIRALEDELGVRLFERSSNGMLLTRSGRALLGQAEKVIAACEEMRRMARTASGELAGRLRIGTLSDPDFIRLGELLGRTVERHPLLELELHHEISGAALEAVREQSLDASFYYGDLAGAEVTGLALGEIVYRVAGPAAWRARLRDADWSALAAMPWILTPPISTHHRLVSGLFERHGVAPSKVIEADNEGVILNLVESGLGLSLVREDLVLGAARAPGVCIWEKARLMTTLWFIYRSDRALDPLVAALLAVLGETWQHNPQPGATARPAPAARRKLHAQPHAPLRRAP